jgi:hypothetical protein
MNIQLSGESCLQADPLLSISRPVIAGYSAEMSIEDLHEEWQTRLRSMQEWICQLLIKNQQLRMALMEAQAKKTRELDEGSARG